MITDMPGEYQEEEAVGSPGTHRGLTTKQANSGSLELKLTNSGHDGFLEVKV